MPSSPGRGHADERRHDVGEDGVGLLRRQLRRAPRPSASPRRGCASTTISWNSLSEVFVNVSIVPAAPRRAGSRSRSRCRRRCTVWCSLCAVVSAARRCRRRRRPAAAVAAGAVVVSPASSSSSPQAARDRARTPATASAAKRVRRVVTCMGSGSSMRFVGRTARGRPRGATVTVLAWRPRVNRCTDGSAASAADTAVTVLETGPIGPV